MTAPKVTISGGSGSGATAYAVLNKDRTLEKIVVTCRGEDYAAGDSVAEEERLTAIQRLENDRRAALGREVSQRRKSSRSILRIS